MHRLLVNATARLPPSSRCRFLQRALPPLAAASFLVTRPLPYATVRLFLTTPTASTSMPRSLPHATVLLPPSGHGRFLPRASLAALRSSNDAARASSRCRSRPRARATWEQAKPEVARRWCRSRAAAPAASGCLCGHGRLAPVRACRWVQRGG